MKIFSRRRFDRNDHSKLFIEDPKKSSIKLLRKFNDDVGYSIDLDSKKTGISYILIESVATNTIAKLQFYYLPRRIRGRKSVATQSVEWQLLPLDPVLVKSGAAEVFEFDPQYIIEIGATLVAGVTINGESPKKSSLTVKQFELITSKEATELEMQTFADQTDQLSKRMESLSTHGINTTVAATNSTTGVRANLCLGETVNQITGDNKLLISSDCTYTDQPSKLITFNNLSKSIKKVGRLTSGSIELGFGSITTAGSITTTGDIAATEGKITTKELSSRKINVSGGLITPKGDDLVIGSASKDVLKIKVNGTEGISVLGDVISTGSLFQALPTVGEGFNIATKWVNRTVNVLLTMQGLVSDAAIKRVIGKSFGVSNAYIGKLETFGTIVFMMIKCLKAPTGGDQNVDFYTNCTILSQADNVESGGEFLKLDDHYGSWQQGDVAYCSIPVNSHYLYIATGAGSSGTYTDGIFLVTMYTA